MKIHSKPLRHQRSCKNIVNRDTINCGNLCMSVSDNVVQNNTKENVVNSATLGTADSIKVANTVSDVFSYVRV